MPSIAIEQPSETDIDAIHAVLRETYWSPGIPRNVVARACANSMCAIARDDTGKLIGFARLVTDKATFAWLCDVIVLPGRTIGEGAIVGAGAVVSRDIPPYAVAAGNPAVVCRYRNQSRYIELARDDRNFVYTKFGHAKQVRPSRHRDA